MHNLVVLDFMTATVRFYTVPSEETNDVEEWITKNTNLAIDNIQYMLSPHLEVEYN